MPLKIAIYCCNHIFGEGIKQLLDNGLDIETTINCSNPEEVIKEKPDPVIKIVLKGLMKQ